MIVIILCLQRSLFLVRKLCPHNCLQTIFQVRYWEGVRNNTAYRKKNLLDRLKQISLSLLEIYFEK
jgi:hypothetical protein